MDYRLVGRSRVHPAAYTQNSSLRGKRRSLWVIRHRRLYQMDTRLYEMDSRLYIRLPPGYIKWITG